MERKMYKFIALHKRDRKPENLHLWQKLLADILAMPEVWTTVLDDDDLLILQSGALVSQMKYHLLARKKGAIIGLLFDSKPNGTNLLPSMRAPDILSEHETKEICTTHGGRLRDNYWGSYVAFIRDDEGAGFTAFKGPLSTLPCLHYRIHGVSVFFSDIDFLSILSKWGVSVDWDFLSNYLIFSYLNSERTPLRGVYQLMPGQRMRLDECDRKFDYLWNPILYCRSGPVPHKSEIAEYIETLRNITFACFSTWSSYFPRAIVNLSGGFDSSLVAGIMSKLPNRPDLACVTYFHTDPLTDERSYARLTSKLTGYKLHEIPERVADPDFTMFYKCPKLLKPYLPTTGWKKVYAEAAIAQEHGAIARITGDGGDEVFGGGKDITAGIDYLYDNGLTADLFGVAFRAARNGNVSFWTALHSMLKRRLTGGMESLTDLLHKADAAWGITPAALNNILSNATPPPWHSPDVQLAPGKRSQADTVMAQYSYASVHADVPFLEPLRPILSQPIVEMCLKLPTYVHQFNGRERGLARAAFSDCLADEVRLRQFKSHNSPIIYDMIATQAKFYVEFLLEGELVRRGLIKKDAIETLRDRLSELTAPQYAHLAQWAGVEAWARAWA